MKKILIVLLIIITLSCTTTKPYETDVTFDAVKYSESRINIKNNENEVVLDLLNELTYFGLILSDNVSLASRNNLSDLNLIDSPTDSQTKASQILKDVWGIINKEEFFGNLNDLYRNGLKKKYISLLNRITLLLKNYTVEISFNLKMYTKNIQNMEKS